MTKQGRVVCGAMEEVVFGRPAAEAVAELAAKAGAGRIFLMVSGTLQRETDEIARIRAALGNKVAAVFDRMPAHTPRQCGGERRGRMAREAGADLIVTVGGGSSSMGPRRCSWAWPMASGTAEAIDGTPLRTGRGRPGRRAHGAADRGADHALGRGVQRHRRRDQRGRPR